MIQRLKEGRTIGAEYFDELLERIRDIRASERLFYQKITDIYAVEAEVNHAAAELGQYGLGGVCIRVIDFAIVTTYGTGACGRDPVIAHC